MLHDREGKREESYHGSPACRGSKSKIRVPAIRKTEESRRYENRARRGWERNSRTLRNDVCLERGIPVASRNFSRDEQTHLGNFLRRLSSWHLVAASASRESAECWTFPDATLPRRSHLRRQGLMLDYRYRISASKPNTPHCVGAA